MSLSKYLLEQHFLEPSCTSCKGSTGPTGLCGHGFSFCYPQHGSRPWWWTSTRRQCCPPPSLATTTGGGMMPLSWNGSGCVSGPGSMVKVELCNSLSQNNKGSSKYNDNLAQHATWHYKLNANKIWINEQKLTGRRFFKVYKGKTWIF